MVRGIGRSDILGGSWARARAALPSSAAAAAGLLGLIALAGWQLRVPFMTRILPGAVSMNPLTAIGMTLLAAAALALDRLACGRRGRKLGAACAALVAIYGVVRLLDYLFGLQVGLDRLLFRARLDQWSPVPNQMAPNTALNFVLLGFSLFSLNGFSPRLTILGQVTALVAGLLSMLAIIGYTSDVATLYGISAYIPMALNTALAFLLLSVAALSAHLRSDARLLSIRWRRDKDRVAAHSLERVVVLGFTCALFVLSVIGIASHQSMNRLLADAHSREHGNQVLAEIADVAAALHGAEAAAQGYAITADADDKASYGRSTVALSLALTDLRRLTKDVPDQRKRLDAIWSTVTDRLVGLDAIISAAHLSGPGVEDRPLHIDGALRNRIQLQLDEMAAEERDRLTERGRQEERTARAAMAVLAVGSLAGFVLVAFAGYLIRRDIGARARAESARRESELQYRFLADFVPQIIWAAEPDGTICYRNQRWAEFTGQGTVGRGKPRWDELVHPEDAGSLTRSWTSSLQTGSGFSAECRLRRRSDGAYRWFLFRSLPRRGPNGQIAQWIGTLTDIENQKLVEADLQLAKSAALRASDAKSEFLAHMSHEIRTPLNGVVGMLDLLLDTSLDERQRRFASLSKTSARALTTVINDILDFSKIEAGKLEMERMDFDLHLVVEDAVELLAQKAGAKGLELACFIDRSVPPDVVGDPDRLRQIIVNLVNNAIKFTKNGAVTVLVTADFVAPEFGMIRFAVSDSGVGIAADRMDRLFKSFSQVDPTTTRTHDGTGLGLAISKQLAELMGGRIGVESLPGRGSTFWFTARFDKRSSLEHRPAPSLDVRGLRVLAVDDHPANRDILTQQLASWNFDGHAAESGSRALRLLSDAATAGRPFKVAIIDEEMPGMSGLELAEAIKIDSRLRDTVLMLMVRVESPIASEQLRRFGIDGLMTKPVRQSQLFDAIMNAQSASRTRREDGGDPAPPSRQASEPPNESSPRILLAEDNEVNRMVACEILARAGLTCVSVVDGREAVEAASRGGFELILMDCQMPNMDGMDATRAIREREAQLSADGTVHRVPIVALTANAIKGDREKCIAAGMDSYVSKPLNPALLIETIQRLLTVRVPQPKPQTPDSAPRLPAMAIDRLRLRWSGDPVFVRKLVARFVKQAPLDLENIEKGLESGDMQQVERVAHGLKGAAGYVEAGALRVICARLEEMSKPGQTEDMRPVIEEMRQEIERCAVQDIEPDLLEV